MKPTKAKENRKTAYKMRTPSASPMWALRNIHASSRFRGKASEPKQQDVLTRRELSGACGLCTCIPTRSLSRKVETDRRERYFTVKDNPPRVTQVPDASSLCVLLADDSEPESFLETDFLALPHANRTMYGQVKSSKRAVAQMKRLALPGSMMRQGDKGTKGEAL